MAKEKQNNVAEQEQQKEKSRAALIAFLAVVCIGLAVLLYNLIQKRADIQNTEQESTLYGIWIEQGVAPYAADNFELKKDGVYYNQKKITKSFEISGTGKKILSFKLTYDKHMECEFMKDQLKCKNPLMHYEQIYKKSLTGYFVKQRT